MSEDARSQPWGRSLRGLVQALPGLFTDRLELLALELSRAGHGIVRIVALVLLAAILAVTAWLALWSCIALALVALGLSWPLSMLVLLLVNVTLALAALVRVRSLVATLGLPATRRHLVFGAGAEAAASGHLQAQPLTTTPEGKP